MEHDSRKIRIVEFNGTPGCGKTTIMKSLAKELGGGVRFDYYRNRVSRNINSVLFSPKYYSLIKLVHKYTNQYPGKKKFSWQLFPAFFIRKYEWFLKDDNSNLLFVDQGFMQSIISLAYTNKLIESRMLSDIFKISGLDDLPILIINCECDVETTLNRIKGRKNNGARVHSMTEIEMRNTIITQIGNFEYVRGIIEKHCRNVKALTLNTSNEVSYNVNLIKKIL